MKKTNFHIINASAGSGKTYTLVLEYLKVLLNNISSKSFRNQLALTFTNRAVNEMKARILITLRSLSNPPSKETHIVLNLCEALNITEKELAFRSDQMLRKMILEYANFDVITLDKFTHRLVRTFAREFQLPYGFEVILDPTNLFDETVNSIIEEVGRDKTLSKLLLDFSLNKVFNDKDWNIQQDLDDFIRLLLNENDRKPLADIKNKALEELKADKKLLEEVLENTKKEALTHAGDALNVIEKNGLEAEDFKRKQIYKHFKKVHNSNFVKLYDNQLEDALAGEKLLYNKTLAQEKKILIDEIQPQLQVFFHQVKKYVGQYFIIDRTLKSWTPRMLIQLMEQRLDTIQDEKEVRLLGQFNSKINRLVKNEPAPFIYERLGERYQNYFLDEFQDTSELQWTNLIPIIGNALESQDLFGESGSLLLVGDPKQAIYRWRGGNMNQYMDLINKSKSPFHVESSLFSLDQNFRSGKEIVDFNNDFFLMLSNFFDKKEFRSIYERGSQQKAQNDGGYVRIESILKGGTKELSTPLYISKTLSLVKEILAQGYRECDIAILVRKKDQAAKIATVLNQEGYNLVSSESMLVAKSKKVQLLVAFLKLSVNPNSSENHKIILDVLWEMFCEDQGEYHKFAVEHIHLKTSDFLKDIGVYFNFTFKMEFLQDQTVFEAVNYILLCFPQIDHEEAYIHFFVEDIYEFSKINYGSISSYLHYWELKSEQLSISMPDELEAIKLMTIHQAKGLEFPVVILPFMDTPIHPSVTEKIWFPFPEGKLERIKWGWFNFSKELQHCGDEALKLYESHLLHQQLDAFNVLYVSLTRAVDALFIITQEVNSGNNTYAQLLKNYVEQKGKSLDPLNPYEKGILYLKKPILSKENDPKNKESNLPLNLTWKNRLVLASPLNEIDREAQNFGLLIHELLAKITTADLISHVLQNAEMEYILNENYKNAVEEKLWEVVRHPELKTFYEGKDKVLCEQDLLMPNGSTLRPDRINFSNAGKVSVLDYKTGSPKKADVDQIKVYQKALNDLGHDQVENYLIYINKEIKVVKAY